MEKITQVLLGLDSHLRSHIKGQDHVIDRVCSVLKRGELGLSHPERPKGSFLFVGPTGTGKTELTQCFSEYLCGAGKLIRFDMSEYMNKSSLGKLIGENEGEIGILGHKLDKNKGGTLLFDEMEKADPSILDLFLQMLDAGRITLSDHKTRSLSNYYIVFTSNIGSSDIRNMTRMPLTTITRAVINQVNEALRPELLGRIKEKLVFNNLSYEVQIDICHDMAKKELKRLAAMGYSLSISSSAINYLISVGYHRSLGARPMREAIEKHLGDLITNQLLEGLPSSGYVTANEQRTGLILKCGKIEAEEDDSEINNLKEPVCCV